MGSMIKANPTKRRKDARLIERIEKRNNVIILLSMVMIDWLN
jgi:hypothetical protein